MNFSQIEKPRPPYSGRGEMALALAVLPLAFLHTLLESLYGSRAIPGQPWPYILLLSAFSAVAICSVLFLATPTGESWIRRMLDEKRLAIIAALPGAYVGLYLLLIRLLDLPQLHTHALAMTRQPWSLLPLPANHRWRTVTSLSAQFTVSGASCRQTIGTSLGPVHIPSRNVTVFSPSRVPISSSADTSRIPA